MTFALGPSTSSRSDGTETRIQTVVVTKCGQHVIFQGSENHFDAVIALALFQLLWREAGTLLWSR